MEKHISDTRTGRQGSTAFGGQDRHSAPPRGFFSWSRRKYPEAGILSQNDPTDNALAAIASILEQPESLRFADKPATPVTVAIPESVATSEKVAIAEKPAIPESPAIQEQPLAPQIVEANGYTKAGPGPMDAVRFKWTVRQDGDNYYVDETIGESSRAIVSGPMSGDAAVKLVNARESEARKRFEALKGEITGRSAASANPAWKSGGEA
jgi:hypothetical protein